MRSLVAKLLFAPYRWLISPAIHAFSGPGFGCRFHPTCGEYAREAVETKGLVKGIALAARRISRCHPWGSSGYDPVP